MNDYIRESIKQGLVIKKVVIDWCFMGMLTDMKSYNKKFLNYKGEWTQEYKIIEESMDQLWEIWNYGNV